ncbi:flagellar M-ring protein FliF C-terminal domain-containing protein, partial [Hydrogenibacillus schlegelii]|uniref:flagellar M-ring protein FliF C-terminal domain-containing protein n=1 Tax=Hydrogenibacillus schlegelii TaxID=1484 RepID=UPI0034A08AED
QATGTGRGQYERTEDRVNYELNRITRTVKEQPYALKDLAVNIPRRRRPRPGSERPEGRRPHRPGPGHRRQRRPSALADAGANAGDPAGRVQVVVEKFPPAPRREGRRPRRGGKTGGGSSPPAVTSR